MLNARLLPLRSDQALLRAMRPGDAAAYASGAADRAVRQYAHLPEPEYTEASATTLIRGAVRDGLQRGDLAVLTIANPATGAFAGSLALFGVDAGSVEVGFWVHPDHRGEGRAGAALALAVEFARRSGFTQLVARTVPENHTSRRVLEQSGFTQGDAIRGIAPSGREVVLLHYLRDLDPIASFPLETARLRLRLHEHADAPALQRIYSRPAVARYLLDDPWSEADAARHLSERMAKTRLDDGSTALALVIVREELVIGDVHPWLTDAQRRIAEIGWVLDPAHGSKGLATESVRTVLGLGFERYGLHRITARMDARNDASARLARRAGMRQEAHLRQDWWNKGEWTDTLIYGALTSDVPAVHSR